MHVPLRGAGDHLIGGGAGPPINFSLSACSALLASPWGGGRRREEGLARLLALPPPSPSPFPRVAAGAASHSGWGLAPLPGWESPAASLSPSLPQPPGAPAPRVLFGASSPPNPNPLGGGDERGDVKPLGGAARHGISPSLGPSVRGDVKPFGGVASLRTGGSRPLRPGRGEGYGFAETMVLPLPPLRCRAALTWRRGLAPFAWVRCSELARRR